MIQHHQHPTKPSRVVVLGAAGFVGHDLMQYLDERGVPSLGLSSAQLDLEQPEAADRLAAILEEDDVLVFASALTPDRGKDTGTLLRNLHMAEHVALALRRQPCKHVIYISSDAVYSGGNPIRESTPCDAPGLYGPMHRLRENILAAALEPQKCPFLVLRPCALYGPGDTHDSYGPNRFVRTACAESRIALVGNGEEKRDHVLVRDFSRLVHACLQSRSTGVLNVAAGRAISFAELAREVARLCSPPVWIEPAARTVPVTHRIFDTAALLRAFPQFRFTPLAEGLAQMISHGERRELNAAEPLPQSAHHG